MKAEKLRLLAKLLIRKGEIELHLAAEDRDLLLSEINLIETYVLHDVRLDRRNGIWWLVCPQIQEELHNFFWFGQQAGSLVTVDKPTRWIADWQKQQMLRRN